jgi:transcriptional regulator with GAF, ATPase, and Fis domain
MCEAGRIKTIKDAVRALEGSAAALKEAALDLTRETAAAQLDIPEGFDFYEAVQRFEVDLIKRALLQTRYNQAKAARLLGIKHTTLNQKIRRYNLSR